MHDLITFAGEHQDLIRLATLALLAYGVIAAQVGRARQNREVARLKDQNGRLMLVLERATGIDADKL